MTRVIVGALVSIGVGWWLVRLVLGYKQHVDYPDLKTRWANLPDPREVGKR